METILNAADIFDHPLPEHVVTQNLVIVPDDESSGFLEYVDNHCNRVGMTERIYSSCFTKKRSEFALPVSKVIAEHGVGPTDCRVLTCIVDLRDLENITWIWVASDLPNV
jgi:hypothetical protein